MAIGLQRSPGVCPELIGRDDVLDHLRGLLDGAADGGGRVGLIVGDAGLGKSRLLRTIKPYAEGRGFLVVQGSCFPQDRTEPYAPIVDALRARFAGLPPAAVAGACGQFADELRPLLPDLFPRPDGGAAAGRPDPERRRLFAALMHCLLHQASPRPVLLVVEDLHWCDEASLDFLFYLARQTKERPFLLLGTYRGDESTAHLRSWVTQLERESLAEEVALAPLRRDEVETMARAIVGSRLPLPTEATDALHALAEGNPFYVEELLAALPDTHVAGGWSWELELPRSLHAAVQQRVDRLSPTARQVLQVAAVVGRRFDFALLQRLAQLDEDGLVSVLEELVGARLLAEESADRFAFRHALTRQAIYAGLLRRTRILLHRRVAEALEQCHATAPDQHLGDLAEHFFRAEVWDKAQAYARRAGERALKLAALRAAVEHFSRALEANGQLVRATPAEEADAPLLAGTAAAAHRGRGRAYALLGDFERARLDGEAALAAAHTAGDLREECLTLLDLGVLWASRDFARAGGQFRAALALARGLDEPSLLAECLNRLGNWHANTPEPWEAILLHREALTIAERGDCPAGVATTLDWLGTTSYLCGDLDGSGAYFERAAALFRALDDRPLLASCLAMLTARAGTYILPSNSAGADDVAAAVRHGEEALALARAIDAPGAEAFALIQLAMTLGPRGEYGRAREMVTQALRVAERIGHGQWTVGAHSALGTLALDLLDAEAARRHLEQALAGARALGSTFWTQRTSAGLALACLLLHEPDRAAAVLAELPAVDGPVRSLGQWWVTYARARLALARRDPALALRLCGQLRPLGVGDASQSDLPLLVRLRAEAVTALRARGVMGTEPAEDVESALRAAREAAQRQGLRSELWRIDAALGAHYRAWGRSDEARHAFVSARAVIEELAAGIPDRSSRNLFLQNATALLPRAYRLSPLTSAAARFGGLSARERDVAALIARGKSNAEIAAALVLGRRTVETHVGNILTKIGASSRREIAAWAIANGLAGGAEARAA